METICCNLCSSNDHRVVYSMPDAKYARDEWFDVVECQDCGLGFVNPRPTRSEIARHYPSSFFDTFTQDAAHHLRRYAAEARYLEGVTGEGDKPLLLDVGCANGDFPRYLQARGWRVEGVEVSPNADEITGFPVYRTELSDIPFDEPRYDAVTAWAVLEHVHDPMAYFRKVARILKPRGLFVFLVTNFNSLSSRGLFLEDIPRHLFFFTEDAVKEYLRINNLTLVKVDYNDEILDWRPANWLRYYAFKHLHRRAMTWNDIPETRIEYFQRLGLKRGLIPLMRYAATHPFATLDRLLLPLYEEWQIMRKSFGIATYVGTKQ